MAFIPMILGGGTQIIIPKFELVNNTSSSNNDKHTAELNLDISEFSTLELGRYEGSIYNGYAGEAKIYGKIGSSTSLIQNYSGSSATIDISGYEGLTITLEWQYNNATVSHYMRINDIKIY